MEKSTRVNGIIYALIMLLFILDAKTVIKGASDAVSLCLQTVIPSLLPFITLSILITASFAGKTIAVMRPISKLCRIPAGAESILLLGFVGGYPVGAQSIYDAWQNGALKRSDAWRMLGFCNNAGPAFIFGMTSALFSSPQVPWALWLIHIASAVIVGVILPGSGTQTHLTQKKRSVTLTQAVENSIVIMARICAWVIVFRVIISVADRWLLFAAGREIQTALCGLLELSNGCAQLFSLPLQGVRFVLCACFLSFGGLSVFFQTRSVTKELGLGFYFPGKILQTLFSLLLSLILQNFLFPASEILYCPAVVEIGVAIVIVLCWGILRKNSSNLQPCVV